MKEYTVEIMDESDGFIVVEAESEKEAERIALDMGYEPLYAHE